MGLEINTTFILDKCFSKKKTEKLIFRYIPIFIQLNEMFKLLIQFPRQKQLRKTKVVLAGLYYSYTTST